jgi:hypothetical protein
MGRIDDWLLITWIPGITAATLFQLVSLFFLYHSGRIRGDYFVSNQIKLFLNLKLVNWQDNSCQFVDV